MKMSNPSMLDGNTTRERKTTHDLIEVGLQLIQKGISISEPAMAIWFEEPNDLPFPAVDTFEPENSL